MFMQLQYNNLFALVRGIEVGTGMEGLTGVETHNTN